MNLECTHHSSCIFLHVKRSARRVFAMTSYISDSSLAFGALLSFSLGKGCSLVGALTATGWLSRRRLALSSSSSAEFLDGSLLSLTVHKSPFVNFCAVVFGGMLSKCLYTASLISTGKSQKLLEVLAERGAVRAEFESNAEAVEDILLPIFLP